MEGRAIGMGTTRMQSLAAAVLEDTTHPSVLVSVVCTCPFQEAVAAAEGEEEDAMAEVTADEDTLASPTIHTADHQAQAATAPLQHSISPNTINKKSPKYPNHTCPTHMGTTSRQVELSTIFLRRSIRHTRICSCLCRRRCRSLFMVLLGCRVRRLWVG